MDYEALARADEARRIEKEKMRKAEAEASRCPYCGACHGHHVANCGELKRRVKGLKA